MTHRVKTDICVIGAGSGGLSVAAGAVQMGAKVVLIEGHKMGGDCLNYGCVPSKALIAAAKQAQTVRKGGFGIAPAEPAIDYAAAKDHVAEVIRTIEPVDSQERFEGLGCTVLRDFAEFISETEVQAGDTVVEARRFVIATGSRPFVPPIPGIDEVPHFTNETIFELREKPDHLIVVGGGPIGLEMAQAHARLGCEVTVLEGLKALGKDDPELAAVVLERLRDEGVRIHEGAQVSRVSGEDGTITVETEDGGSHTGSHLLVAVGRTPNVDRLNLEAAGIEYDRRGLKVDASLRTSNRRVFGVGDVAGPLQFTHVAGYHAGVVIRQIVLGLPAKVRSDHIPWATYTDPELAQVGLTEAQAREQFGGKLEVARFPYRENDRAIASGRTTGLIKLMVVKGRPVGASVAGADAGELIGLWAYAIANRHKLSAVANMIAPYPTLGEVNKRAAGAYFAPRLFESNLVKRIVRIVQKF